MRKVLLLCLFLLPTFSGNAEENINVTNFASGKLDAWQTKVFSGVTDYQIVDHDGQNVLAANSDGAASGMMLERQIDLIKTPYINWSWLVKNRLSNLEEQTKEGDDYSARIYIVLGNSWMVWNIKALNYVWSSNQQEGARWDNAHVKGKAKMIAIKGSSAKANLWYDEKRNVYQDLIASFGDKGSDEKNQKAYRYIDVIAIMTDTDNCGQQAVAYYGDIIFSKN